MASPKGTCPTCWKSYLITELNAHRVGVHKAAECKLCDKVFATQHGLKSHVLASPATHREGHAVRCTRPNCNPRSCPSAYTGDSGTSVSSSSSISVIITSSPSPAAQPSIFRAASPVKVTIAAPPPSRSDNNSFYCGICNTTFSSRKKLGSHMQANVDHHILHDRFCRVVNCNPRKCFQRTARNGEAPAADSDIGADGASTTPAARRIVEPGPPDPVQAGPPAASSLQGPVPAPDPSSSASAQPKRKKKKKKKKAAPPAHTPSYGGFDFSDDEEPFSWRSYVSQRALMIGRQLDLDDEVEYDSRGEGWCIFCHGPSNGRWEHSCPGYSD